MSKTDHTVDPESGLVPDVQSKFNSSILSATGAPHTVPSHSVEDSIRITESGLRNLTAMREDFPDAVLEDVPGVGRVWVSRSAIRSLVDFVVAVGRSGEAYLVPFARGGTIEVFLPTIHPRSRMSLKDLRQNFPDVCAGIVDSLKGMEP